MKYLQKYNVTKAQIKKWYEVENKTYSELMNIFKIKSARAIKQMLIESGIKPKDRSEAVRLQWVNAENRKKNQSDFAKKAFAPHRGKHFTDEVRKKISESKLGPKNAMYGKTGRKHHLFLGGKKTWSKGRKIQPAKKSKIRRALGDKCKECGATEDLTLHHVVPWRKSRSHDLSNLELLCKDCHFSKPLHER